MPFLRKAALILFLSAWAMVGCKGQSDEVDRQAQAQAVAESKLVAAPAPNLATYQEWQDALQGLGAIRASETKENDDATHRIIDAALDLVRDHGIRPGQVRAMEATVGPAQAAMLRNARPRDALQARFSLQFAVAAPLVARACGLAQLQDDFVQQPAVQALFERLVVRTVDSAHPVEPTLAASDRLVMHLHDGRTVDSGEVFSARGDPGSPLSEQDMAAKFGDCTRDMDPVRRQSLWASLSALASLDDVAGIG